jgi:hypothetical protein
LSLEDESVDHSDKAEGFILFPVERGRTRQQFSRTAVRRWLLRTSLGFGRWLRLFNR